MEIYMLFMWFVFIIEYDLTMEPVSAMEQSFHQFNKNVHSDYRIYAYESLHYWQPLYNEFDSLSGIFWNMLYLDA